MEHQYRIQKLFSLLYSSYKFERRHIVVFSILEIIFLLAVGGFFGGIFGENARWMVLLFAVTLLIGGYFAYVRLTREASFTISGLGELEALTRVSILTRELKRKKILDTYIDEAVISLNSNTCTIQGADDTALCDKNIEDGMASVYKPFIQNPQYLLETPNARFTVGIHLDEFLKLPTSFPPNYLNASEVNGAKTFIARDDFNLRQWFPDNIMEDDDMIDLQFRFQTQFKDTFKHSKVISNPFIFSDTNLTLITCPIPLVCEIPEDTEFYMRNNGVLFIVCEEIALPDDFSNVAIIFNRLFSNWLSKYDDCVGKRLERHNLKYPLPEIKSVPSAEEIKIDVGSTSN
ncbi:hypothetical protein [uncultured Chitinophaga sp.]|uniref:hypothetical protein n=1 Tax=uncultured Chitinophaga sp. TaxID=339340 RepID=UPI0025DBDC32|nr:hypothetical protein [uncultured Chitinophaga sp.]